MTKKFFLFLTLTVLAPLPAFAHGDSLKLATPAAVAERCGGDSLVSYTEIEPTGNLRWMKVTGFGGALVAIVGLDRTPTQHGYFVQATCLDPDSGVITAVTLMRAATDEVAELRAAMKKGKWWSDFAPSNASPMAGALYKSVMNAQKRYASYTKSGR